MFVLRTHVVIDTLTNFSSVCHLLLQFGKDRARICSFVQGGWVGEGGCTLVYYGPTYYTYYPEVSVMAKLQAITQPVEQLINPV